MRQARVQDWHRRLRTRQNDWLVKLCSFVITDIPRLGTAEISFSSPLTVLSGPNGVGKSTLLRAFWMALDPDRASAIPAAPRKLTGGEASAALINNGQPETATIEFSASGFRITSNITAASVYIDPATETSAIQKEFCKFDSVEDITNGVGVRDIDPAKLAELNYILHRDYRSVSLYEVEMDGTVPFFEVSYGNDRYDSRTMGSGEIAAFYLWWYLDRVEENTIVLLEEPEAFLSHACQQTLANHIVASTVRKKLCTVVSSHSPPLITSLSNDSLRFVSRDARGIQIIIDRPPPILLRSIGIHSPLKALLFVEDIAALSFCKNLLERHDPAMARAISVELRNGEGEITNTLRSLKGLETEIRFIGVYDGDMKGKISVDLASVSTCLPENEAIEVVFRNMVIANKAGFSEQTGAEHLETILAGLEGSNHHDWYEEICKELGLTKTQLLPQLFSLWFRDEGNREESRKTFEFIKELMSTA